MSSLNITGLAYLIVNDTDYKELQAKAFRDIASQTNDEPGACKGVRLFLEFLERNASEYNAEEEVTKKKGVKKVAGLEPPTFTPITPGGDPSTDLDLNPPNEQ